MTDDDNGNNMSSEEMLREAVAWGSGEKSHLNMIDSFSNSEMRVITSTADAMTSLGFFIAALAQDRLESYVEN